MKCLSSLFAVIMLVSSAVSAAAQSADRRDDCCERPSYDIPLAKSAAFLRSQLTPTRKERLLRCEALEIGRARGLVVAMPQECSEANDIRTLASYVAICENAANKERALNNKDSRIQRDDRETVREDTARAAANCAVWAWDVGYGEEEMKPH